MAQNMVLSGKTAVSTARTSAFAGRSLRVQQVVRPAQVQNLILGASMRGAGMACSEQQRLRCFYVDAIVKSESSLGS